jgi:hypothetical protein
LDQDTQLSYTPSGTTSKAKAVSGQETPRKEKETAPYRIGYSTDRIGRRRRPKPCLVKRLSRISREKQWASNEAALDQETQPSYTPSGTTSKAKAESGQEFHGKMGRQLRFGSETQPKELEDAEGQSPVGSRSSTEIKEKTIELQTKLRWI